MIIYLVGIVVFLVLVHYLSQVFSRFYRYGVKFDMPLPIIGNMADMLLRRKHIVDALQEIYNRYSKERFIVRYEFSNPIVIVHDIELVKKITVKDFEHFLDHRSIFSNSDSYFGRNLFSMKGQEWKDMRSTLSPAFTSSKIRLMVPFMVEVGDQMILALKQKLKDSKADTLEVDVKDMTTRFANDVVATCAFGLKVDSHHDPENSFYVMGKKISTFTFRQILTFFFLMNLPKLAKLMKLDFLTEEGKLFFKDLFMGTMRDREERNIIRPDMIHLLMEAKKGKLTHDEVKTNDTAAGFATVEESSVGQTKINRVWTDHDLIAQAVLFFIAGFETVSSGMSFLLYELAVNPDVQDRLAQEIKEVDAKNNGKIDFNSIQNMVYMDMVVSELLRMWPPGIALDRICVKDYNLGKPNDTAERDFIVQKGTGISIPVYAFHRDPKFFPNPNKFDPERFSEKNKHLISTFVYMPFGSGPRNCIGSRFALFEIKVLTYQILQHFVLSPSAKTCIPAELCKETFNIKLKGGHWLDFQIRTYGTFKRQIDRRHYVNVFAYIYFFLQKMIIFLIWVAVLIAVLVLYLRQVYSRFSRYGVKFLKPVPLLGNMGRVLFRREHFAYDILNLYRTFPEERFVGRFEFLNEMVMIRDIELIKKITVKDFEYFLDHRTLGSDSVFGRSLFFLKGQEWKDMRSTLSPAFTSSKIRLMIPFMVDVGDQMTETLKRKIKASKDGYLDVDCKDLTTRYSNDVIASCAFGLKVNSHTEVDNQFYTMGKEATNFNFRQMIMFFLLVNMPKVIKFMKWEMISEVPRTFFRNLVLDTMKDRELRHIIRPDMIHLLMEAKKGKLSHEDVQPNDAAAGFATVEESSVGQKELNRVWHDDDLIAQAVLFFVAGFESVSSTMSFLLYELAVNPDVQERLAQEVKEHDIKNGGKFDFTSIQNMTYMDMVVSELLRRWPPAVAMDRVCNRDYNLGKPNDKAEKDFILRKGTCVMMPTFAFHQDPEFFPDPEKFDPERFSEENKHRIQPLSYMPFGLGPRNCIGSRFALCELKVMTYQVLRQMVLSPCERTCIPAELSTDSFNIRLQGGHWLRFKLRE
ncbi:uncharacterized protein LOC113495130 [Trichoplusia ni]|uniref:unspecific monooxygenase n=1 Tax=Trichoplusia ni TaxID=7111 RepID=A0A7E5VMI9_TRINI|nr:uncharacterized protein LOC113495130 [Trichoplusia ni]